MRALLTLLIRFGRLYLLLMLALGWLIVVVEMPRHLAKDEPSELIAIDLARRAAETLSMAGGIVAGLALIIVLIGARRQGCLTPLLAAGPGGCRCLRRLLLAAAGVAMLGTFATDLVQHWAESRLRVRPQGSWLTDGAGQFEWRTDVPHLVDQWRRRGHELPAEQLPAAAWRLGLDDPAVWRRRRAEDPWQPMWPQAASSPPPLDMRPVLPSTSSLFDPYGWQRPWSQRLLGVAVRLGITGVSVLAAGLGALLFTSRRMWLSFALAPAAFIVSAGLGLRGLIDLWSHGEPLLALAMLGLSLATLIYGIRRLQRQGVIYA